MSYFDQSIFFSSSALARSMSNLADEAFKSMDITPTQGFTLIAINEIGLHGPSDIAKELYMQPSTITRFVDKLEMLGYVKREYKGRKVEIYLTDKGLEKAKEASKCLERLNSLTLEVLPKPQKDQVVEGIVNLNNLFTKHYASKKLKK